MSPVVSGLIGGAIAFGLVTLANRTQKSAAKAEGGWNALHTGWLINGTIAGSAALAALFGYFLVSGGSARPDAQTQNAIAALLLVSFTGYALYIAWLVFGRTIMWKGYELRVRTLTGKEVIRRITDVTHVMKHEKLGEYRLTFRDQSTLRFSAHQHGANELLKELPGRASRS
jgi:hypothetical protein